MNIGDGRGGLPSGNSFISLLLVTLIAICVLVWSKAAGVVLGAVGGYAIHAPIRRALGAHPPPLRWSEDHCDPTSPPSSMSP